MAVITVAINTPWLLFIQTLLLWLLLHRGHYSYNCFITVTIYYTVTIIHVANADVAMIHMAVITVAIITPWLVLYMWPLLLWLLFVWPLWRASKNTYFYRNIYICYFYLNSG